VYDGVIGPWFLPTFARATGLACLDCLVVLPSLERCVGRVATRQGHGFTDEGATCKMHGEFARAAVDRRHVLLDPPDDPERRRRGGDAHTATTAPPRRGSPAPTIRPVSGSRRTAWQPPKKTLGPLKRAITIPSRFVGSAPGST
jgi:hypothetical protein